MLEDLLKQNRVLYYFSEISRIPRGSGNMEAIGRFVYEKALSFGLEAMTDEFHNVVARVPATKGYENAPVVMLQGHLDMVAEKTPDSDHDFLHDPIELILEGDILHANKTTLGGDDGVAVAMMLAIMEDKSLEHPELECVFTVDEETGMNGAQGLDTSVLKAKYLVNMDNEYESDFIVSCAGGAGIMGVLSVPQEDHIEVSGRKVLVTLSSELGGHSGTEIHRNRPNTNHLFGKLLRKLSDDGVCYHLVSINGGRLDNAICTHTEAVIVTNDSIDSEKVEAFLQADFVNSDDHPHVTFETVKEDATMSAISDEKRDQLVETLLSLPNGVVSFSEDIEGLVQTSLNLGVIRTDYTEITIRYSVRSSVTEEKMALLEKLEGIFSRYGSFVLGEMYPGWAYRKESPLRDLMVKIYKEKYTPISGREPVVEAIHAGLECGLLLEKMPDLDIVSIGSDAIDIHTPGEYIVVSSVIRTYDYILDVLKELKA